MSVSSIPSDVRCRLWGRASGRCQYRGCQLALWKDDLTKAEFNSSYIAHIVADKPGGPRGHPTRSEELKADIRNLMLLCDVHHRLVDTADVAGHPEALLLEMKREHEERTERVSGVDRNRRSDILLYGANIGDAVRLPTREEAADAILPEWYPARDDPFELALKCSYNTDRDAMFWAQEAQNLRRGFEQLVRPGLRSQAVQHLSVFGLAPQPLLMLLGTCIVDLVPTEVYQLHREPTTWKWQSAGETQRLVVREPTSCRGEPALVLSLSATIGSDRVHAVLGQNVAIWTVAVERPHNDYLRQPDQLREFREVVRKLLDVIKSAYGSKTTLHVFPAAPVSACVEFGRIIMPKADMPQRIYDENRRLGGFVHALDLDSNGEEARS